MRIAVVEILALPERRPVNVVYNLLLMKQYASVMPQAVSVWCRQLGHEVNYATYYGLGDPSRLVPHDADLVFFSCYTQVSPIAYALSKMARARGTKTVLGGPHAKAFARDAIRFFDHVVGECDRNLVVALLRGEFAPGTILSSAAPPTELPSVEERMPEIRHSALFFGRARAPTTTIALLASLGCPYTCSFCIDWKSKYRPMPRDRLIADLRYIRRTMPRALVAFHDPNFAIKFDETLSALEEQDAPLPYIMESSLSVLKPTRMARLRDTNCVFIAPGVESWDDFSAKANGASKRGVEKVESVAAQFADLHRHVSALQANFIFGLDTDRGDTPVDLLKSFMDKTPFVWPVLNIPVPFGGTPLFDQLRREARIQEAMPFLFYYAPYLTVRVRHYEVRDYYRRLIQLTEHSASFAMLRRRLAAAGSKTEKAVVTSRSLSTRTEGFKYRRLLRAMETDADLRSFHDRPGGRLPDFYRAEYASSLGRYADMLTEDERRPVLDQDVGTAHAA